MRGGPQSIRLDPHLTSHLPSSHCCVDTPENLDVGEENCFVDEEPPQFFIPLHLLLLIKLNYAESLES